MSVCWVVSSEWLLPPGGCVDKSREWLLKRKETLKERKRAKKKKKNHRHKKKLQPESAAASVLSDLVAFQCYEYKEEQEQRNT